MSGSIEMQYAMTSDVGMQTPMDDVDVGFDARPFDRAAIE